MYIYIYIYVHIVYQTSGWVRKNHPEGRIFDLKEPTNQEPQFRRMKVQDIQGLGFIRCRIFWCRSGLCERTFQN